MKVIECNHCGDDVIMPKDEHSAERVVKGETPLEHMDRTGHSPKSPVTMVCHGCENVWPYKGSHDRPTCPNCAGKNVEQA